MFTVLSKYYNYATSIAESLATRTYETSTTSETVYCDAVKWHNEPSARLLLLSGFIRQNIAFLQNDTEYKLFRVIPKSIIELITEFHAQIRVRFSIFDERHSIITNDNIIKATNDKNTQRVFVSNIGLKEGTHHWTLRCSSSSSVIVGVVQSMTQQHINTIYSCSPWLYNDELFGAYMFDPQWNQAMDTALTRGEIYTMDITIELDCDRNYISFRTRIVDETQHVYVENHALNISQTMNIIQNTTYYPCLGFYFYDEQYQNIFCERLDCVQCNAIHQTQQKHVVL